MSWHLKIVLTSKILWWLLLSWFWREVLQIIPQIARFMGPTWGPPGSCQPQMGPCWPHEPCYQGTLKTFYPRPVLASGYCCCPCSSVRLSVRHQVCLHNNSSSVQARITKFGPKMQNTLVKVPIVLRGNQPWPSRSNLRSKSKFTPFWACPHHNSSPIQARITKFGPEVQNTLVKIPIVLGGNWPRPSRSNLT